MTYTGKKVYDPLTGTYSTGYWIKDSEVKEDKTTNYCPDCINRSVEITTNLLKGIGAIKED